jgi:hypothetical protein
LLGTKKKNRTIFLGSKTLARIKLKKMRNVSYVNNVFQVSIVSVVYSQSELLQKEVFLVELVDSISKSKESMSHLKAVYFLRPTLENIQHLRRQLANPRFGESHLCKFLSKGFGGSVIIFFFI